MDLDQLNPVTKVILAVAYTAALVVLAVTGVISGEAALTGLGGIMLPSALGAAKQLYSGQ